MDRFLIWVRAEWDRVAGFALIVLGALALLFGYLGVRHSPYVAEELAFIISGGLGGLFLLGLGGIFLISADLRDEWRKLDRIEALLRVDLGIDLTTEGDEEVAQPEESVTVLEQQGDADGHKAGPLVGTARTVLAGTPPVATPRFSAVFRAGVAGCAVAVVILVAAWQRAANTEDPAPAFRAAALGGAGLALVAVLAALTVLWLRRLVGLRQAYLLRPLAVAGMASTVASSDPAGRPAPDLVVVVPGAARFHRPGCAVLGEVTGEYVDRSRVPRSLRPCGLCEA